MNHFVRFTKLIALVWLCLSGAARALTPIEYTQLSQDTTWGPGAAFQADTVYVVETDLVVEAGFRLTIQAGVEIQFAPGASLTIGAGTNGRLVVAGTAQSPVVMRAEDNQVGSWDGLVLLRTANSSLSHLVVRHGAVNIEARTAGFTATNLTSEDALVSALRVVDVSPSVSDSVFRRAAEGPAVELVGDLARPNWLRNTIGPSGTWLAQSAPNGVAHLANGTTFVRNLVPEKFNAIRVTEGTLAHSATWPGLGAVAYVVGPGGLTIAGEEVPLLTLGQGALVKVDPAPNDAYVTIGSDDPDRQGGLIATGVTFTSLVDDSIGGDTDGQGLSVAGPGSWGGLVFLRYALDNARVSGSEVRFAGRANEPYWEAPLGPGDGYGAITIVDTAVSILDTAVTDTGGDGVTLYGTASLTASGSEIARAGRHGLNHRGTGEVVIDSTTFEMCGGYGLIIDNGVVTGSTFGGMGAFAVSVGPELAGRISQGDNTFAPGPPPLRRQAIEVRGGVIDEDTTWGPLPGSMVYLIRPNEVIRVEAPEPPRLTIQGAIVKASGPGSFIAAGAYEPTAGGELVVIDSTFTSASDDSVGGDTLGDGISTGSPGDWGGLAILEYGHGDITGSTLRFGGHRIPYNGPLYDLSFPRPPDPDHGVLTVQGVLNVENTILRDNDLGLSIMRGTVVAEDLLIADSTLFGVACRYAGSALSASSTRVIGSGDDGLRCGDGAVTFIDGEVIGNEGLGLIAGEATVMGTLFQNNGNLPVSVGAASVASLTSAQADNTFTRRVDGRFNAIGVRTGLLTADATWGALADGFIYLVASGASVGIAGPTGPTLTLANAVVKAEPGPTLAMTFEVGTPELATTGHLVLAGATLTSSDDDAIRGDTLADGLTEVRPWNGIRVHRSGQLSATDTLLAYGGTAMQLADGLRFGAVTSEGGQVDLTRTTVRKSGQFGISATGGSLVMDTVVIDQARGDGVSTREFTALSGRRLTVRGATGHGLFADTAALTASRFEPAGILPVSVRARAVSALTAPTANNTLVASASGRRNGLGVRLDLIESGVHTWHPLPPGFAYVLESGGVVKVEGEPGTRLSLEPGTIVKAGGRLGGARYAFISVGGNDISREGRFEAHGAIFTSVYDDTVAGDTLGDGPVALPEDEGLWGGLDFHPTGTATLTDVEVRHAGLFQPIENVGEVINFPRGMLVSYGAITSDAGSLTLTRVRLLDSRLNGLRVLGGQVTATDLEVRRVASIPAPPPDDPNGQGVVQRAGLLDVSGGVIEETSQTLAEVIDAHFAGVTFGQANAPFIRLSATAVDGLVDPLARNVFVRRTAPATHNAIYITSGLITDDAAWPALPEGLAYVIDSGARIEVHDGDAPVLTVGPGAVLKFGGLDARAIGTYLQAGHQTDPLRPGAIVATGSTFTAFEDDTIAGDTNADGPGEPTLWGGVVVARWADARTSFSGNLFRFGGAIQPAVQAGTGPLGPGDTYGALTLAGAATVTNNRFEFNHRGVQVVGVGPTLTRPVFIDNEVGLRVQSGNPRVFEGRFENSLAFGVETLAGVTDARGAFWGNSTGPTHPSNPGGSGDPVTDRVLFDPWQTTASDIEAPRPVQDLRVTAVSPSTVTLAFTAPGDDLDEGLAARYELRAFTVPPTRSTFSSGTLIATPTPSPVGTLETVIATALPGQTTWYFAVVAVDDANNMAALSNTADSGPPLISAFGPTRLIAGQTSSMRIEGSRFFPGAVASLVRGGQTLTAETSGTLEDLQAVFAPGPDDGGTFTLVVTNPDGKTDVRPISVIIESLDDPSASTLEPQNVSVAIGDELELTVVGRLVPESFSVDRPDLAALDGATLTALAPGVVRVSATGQGLTITGGPITIEADFDRDRADDRCEIAAGLDHRDPTDATLDLDGDGVINREECAIGASPQVADTSLRVIALDPAEPPETTALPTPGATVHVDGDPSYPGRDRGETPALAAVDRIATPHTIAVMAPGRATVYRTATTASPATRLEVSPERTREPLAFAPPVDLSLGQAIAVLPVDLDRNGELDRVIVRPNGQLATDIPGVVLLRAGDPISLAPGSVPALVDWNGDGRHDVLGQDSQGRIVVHVALADRTTFAAAVPAEAATGPLTVAAPARLVAVDRDRDGARDLLIGLPDGTLMHRENIGTDSAPILGAGQLVQTDLLTPRDVGDRASPAFVYELDGDGLVDLAVGNARGQVRLYRHVEGGAPLTFPDEPSRVLAIGFEEAIAPVLYDADGDGLIDLVVAGPVGGARLLRGLDTIAAPSDLAAIGTANVVLATWSPNTERGLSGYRVERGDSATGPFAVLGNVPANVTTWFDQTASIGATYYYRVIALSPLGASAPSAPVQVAAVNASELTIAPATAQTLTHGEGLILTVSGGQPAYRFIVMNPEAGLMDEAGPGGRFVSTAALDRDLTTQVLVLDALSNAAFSPQITVVADNEPDLMPDRWEAQYELDLDEDDAALDPDLDGLTNLEEYLAGSDPRDPDSDDDGTLDGDDSDPTTDDRESDPDGDGIPNQQERSLGLDETVDDRLTDHDEDLMPTAWEVLSGTDFRVADAHLDGDGDELPNLVEFVAGTPPLEDNTDLFDTDLDGLPDVYELRFGLNPAVPDATEDLDEDFIPNGLEYLAGLDPTVPLSRQVDRDQDGLPDLWEVAFGTDPEVKDGLLDPDLDDLPNLIELRTGGLPLSAEEQRPDRDQDGLPDVWERVMERDPEVSNAGSDPDEDDRPDLIERLSGSPPDLHDGALSDVDGDGMPDYWETAHGLAARTSSALDNADADDRPDFVEWRDGTNPGRQAADTDNDDLADSWEKAWGVFDPDANPDGDPFLNRDEYRSGDNPIELTPYTLEILPRNAFVPVQGTQAFIALRAVGPVTWTVSPPELGRISPTGVVTGLAQGLLTVRAEDENGASGETLLFVFGGSATPGSLLVTPTGSQLVPIGETLDTAAQGGTPPYLYELTDERAGRLEGQTFEALGDPRVREDLVTQIVVTDFDQTVAVSGLITVPWDHDGDGVHDHWELDNPIDGPLDPNGDEDGDGINNGDENELGTNPVDGDSDDDGLPDPWEVENGTDPLDPDADADPDGDGLDNATEFENDRDPRIDDSELDTDGDLMDDAFEILEGLDPDDPSDAAGDPDGDGLPNLVEYLDETPPRVDNTTLSDRDGDRMPDQWEELVGTDPDVKDHSLDPDVDDFPNYFEYLVGSHPFGHNLGLIDRDQDDLPDHWELAFATDPRVDDASVDIDADGRNNFVEYRDATWPRRLDADSDGDGLGDHWEHGWDIAIPGNADADFLTDFEEWQRGTNPRVADPIDGALRVSPETLTLAVGDQRAFAFSGGSRPYRSIAVGRGADLVELTLLERDEALLGAGDIYAKAVGEAELVATDGTGAEVRLAITIVARPLTLSPASLDLNVGSEVRLVASGGVPPYVFSSADDTMAEVLEPEGGLVLARAVGQVQITVRDAQGALAHTTLEIGESVGRFSFGDEDGGCQGGGSPLTPVLIGLGLASILGLARFQRRRSR